MSNLGASKLTKYGEILFAKSQTGIEVKFTKICLGDGIAENSYNLNNIVNSRLERPVDLLNHISGSNVFEVGAAFSNRELKEGFLVNEIGVYAIDPDIGEILYSYACIEGEKDTSSFIAPGVGATIVDYEFTMITSVSNASEVNLTIDPSATYMRDVEIYSNDEKVGNVRKLNFKGQDISVENGLAHIEINSSAINDKLEEHIENKSIHLSEEERKVFEEIIKEHEENPPTENSRDVTRVSMQTGFTYSLNSLDRFTNKVLIPITFNTRKSIPKVNIIGDFSIQTSTGLMELESLDVKSTSYNYVVLEGVLKSSYPLNSPVVLLGSENAEIKIESSLLTGADVEEIKATEENQITAFIGFTQNLDDKEVNEYGEVDKVLITLPYNTRETVPNISILGKFSVRTGSSRSISLSSLQVKETTKSYALLEGVLTEVYPINSPLALVFDTVTSKIVIRD